jgi:hypothetical protein
MTAIAIGIRVNPYQSVMKQGCKFIRFICVVIYPETAIVNKLVNLLNMAQGVYNMFICQLTREFHEKAISFNDTVFPADEYICIRLIHTETADHNVA